MWRRRVALGGLAMAIVAVLVASAVPTEAADPPAGTISASAPTVFWDGQSPLTPNALDQFGCRDEVPGAPSCDAFLLTTVDAGVVAGRLDDYAACEQLFNLARPHAWIYGPDGELVTTSSRDEDDVCADSEIFVFTAAAGATYRIVTGEPLTPEYFYASAGYAG